jgi:hypothetical protein
MYIYTTHIRIRTKTSGIDICNIHIYDIYIYIIEISCYTIEKNCSKLFSWCVPPRCRRSHQDELKSHDRHRRVSSEAETEDGGHPLGTRCVTIWGSCQHHPFMVFGIVYWIELGTGFNGSLAMFHCHVSLAEGSHLHIYIPTYIPIYLPTYLHRYIDT